MRFLLLGAACHVIFQSAHCGLSASRPTQGTDELELEPVNTDTLASTGTLGASATHTEVPKPDVVINIPDSSGTSEIEPVDTAIVEPSIDVAPAETSVPPGWLHCKGRLPRFRYFPWQWGYERTGMISNLDYRDFKSLAELCASRHMKWAFGNLVDYCRAHCIDWTPHVNWLPIEPYLARLETYHDLWYRVRTQRREPKWMPLRCNPNDMDPDYTWPSTYGADYRGWFPTLESLCRENYRPPWTPGIPFGLGCECKQENSPPVCPRDNALWPITPIYGTRRTPLRHPRNSITRVNVWEYDDYLKIQSAFVPRCESDCLCHQATDKDLARLQAVASDLGRHFPNWYTARGAAAVDRNVQKSYGAFGVGCSSNRECASGSRCEIGADSSKLVLGVGAELVFKAACVAIVQSVSGSRLNGRGMSDGTTMMGLESGVMGTICPCNVTYVSETCCDSPDGLVYEAADRKKGVLSL